MRRKDCTVALTQIRKMLLSYNVGNVVNWTTLRRCHPVILLYYLVHNGVIPTKSRKCLHESACSGNSLEK